MNLIHRLKSLIYPYYSKIFRRVVITEGVIRNSNEPIRMLYFGDNARRSYLDDNLYETPSKTIANKVSRFSKLDSIISEYNPDLALIYLPTRWDKLKEKYRHYQTLHFITQKIDVSGSWDDVKKQFGRSKKTFVNQVESKYGFSSRLSNDLKDLDHFYHNMYLPYISTRFNDEYLMLDSYEEMKALFEKGFLIMVSHDGKEILGALMIEEGDSLNYRRVGILDGNNQYNDSKAQMAMYYYMIITAREKGFQYMNAMESLAFFNDGVYQNKWRWGAELFKNDPTDVLPYFLILNNKKNTIDFFRESPIIINTQQGLFGLLGWDGDLELSDADKKSLKKSYHAKGLDGMVLLKPEESETQIYLFD